LPGTLPGPPGDRDLRSHEAFTADNVLPPQAVEMVS
jgi:hypothetical protein